MLFLVEFKQMIRNPIFMIILLLLVSMGIANHQGNQRAWNTEVHKQMAEFELSTLDDPQGLRYALQKQVVQAYEEEDFRKVIQYRWQLSQLDKKEGVTTADPRLIELSQQKLQALVDAQVNPEPFDTNHFQLNLMNPVRGLHFIVDNLIRLQMMMGPLLLIFYLGSSLAGEFRKGGGKVEFYLLLHASRTRTFLRRWLAVLASACLLIFISQLVVFVVASLQKGVGSFRYPAFINLSSQESWQLNLISLVTQGRLFVQSVIALIAVILFLSGLAFILGAILKNGAYTTGLMILFYLIFRQTPKIFWNPFYCMNFESMVMNPEIAGSPPLLFGVLWLSLLGTTMMLISLVLLERHHSY